MMRKIDSSITRRKKFLENFAYTLQNLFRASYLQSINTPVSSTLMATLKNIVFNVEVEEYGPAYDGWYPKLFYNMSDQQILKGVGNEITDIYDDSEEQGSVLHFGICSRPRVAAIYVDSVKRPSVYLIPCLDVREIVTPYPKVISDERFEVMLKESPKVGVLSFD